MSEEMQGSSAGQNQVGAISETTQVGATDPNPEPIDPNREYNEAKAKRYAELLDGMIALDDKMRENNHSLVVLLNDIARQYGCVF